MGLRGSTLIPRLGELVGSPWKRDGDMSPLQIHELDAITRALCTLFDAPFSLVTLFTDRRVLKIKNTVSGSGLPKKMRLEHSLCGKLLLPSRPEALAVTDARHDRRFSNLPGVVGDPQIRSYMGVPLVTERASRIGTLCVIDRRVRAWSAEDLSLVANLAQIVVETLCQGYSRQALALCDIAQENWGLLYTNKVWSDKWGHNADFWSACKSPDLSTKPSFRYRSRVSQRCKFTVTCLDQDEKHVTTVLFTPASIPITDIAIPSLPAGESSRIASLYIVTSLAREDTLDLRGPPSRVPGMQDCSVGPMLGKGGYGTVYHGEWHGESVAVKIIPIDHTCERPWSEAVIMNDLRHRNLVTLHDWVTTPTDTFIVMELCLGGCLRQAIDRGDVMGHQAQMGLARGIAEGMAHLHHLGIVHADLNSNNILLDDEGTPKVADFGLSRMLTGQVTTETCGMLTHAPLELLVTGSLTRGTDVYAFGVILWEIFDQHRPFAGMTRDQIMFAKLQRCDSFEVPAGVPDVVSNLIDACTDPEPRNRPSFASILETLSSHP